MRLLSNLVLLLGLGVTTWALHESDVGIVDWNKLYIGVPLTGSVTTAPAFHHVGDKTIVLTATGSNVLAALNPEDGSILWRYLFDPEDVIAGYYKHENTVATLSGPGGSTLRTFDALTGQLHVEKRLHLPEIGLLSEPVFIGKHVIFTPDSRDIYVLSNGYTVTKIDSETGEVKWSWSSPDQSSLIVQSKLILNSDTLYVIGMSKSFASYTLHVSTLSPSTGQVIISANIPSSIVDPLAHFAVLSRPNTTQPQALWIEQETLRFVGLTPTLKEKGRQLQGTGYTRILDIGLIDQGHAVVSRKEGSSFVLKFDEVNSAKSVWEFVDSVSSGEIADPLYTGVLDRLGHPYVARVCWSHKMEKGSADVFAGHLVGGLGFLSGFVFPFDTTSHGIIGHVAIDSESSSEQKISTRLLVTTSTGAVQLWTQSELKWVREESLANIVVAEFAELPERASESGVDSTGKGFFARITRQLVMVQDLPRFLVSFARRFVTGFYASTHSVPLSHSSSKSSNSTEPLLFRDAFGFRQIIVAGTAHGKVFGIDSSNGEIVWSRVFGLGWAGEIGGRVVPVKLFVTKTVADGGDPEVVIVTQRRADNTLVDTVIFHLNARTGEDALGVSKRGSFLQGLDVIQGSLVEAYLLQTEMKMVVLFDEFLQAYLYPTTPATQAAFAKIAASLSFPLRIHSEDTEDGGRLRILGHQVSIDESSTGLPPVAYPTWSLSLPVDEDIQALLPAATRGPVASIGKVLGNRTTLYKYLNPRLFTVLTASPTRSICGIYVVDSMKGTLVYHAEVRSSLRGCEVKTALMENWLVYHYYESDGTTGGAKGYRMVSVEFYEGQKVDEKTKSLEISAFSNATTNFMKYEQSYVFPHGITALAPTSTKFGITTKDLIVATQDRRIHSFSRRSLDPRRPHRKPTTEELEEFLVAYDPVQPNDPRRVLSHNYDVANVRRIVTAPALLESTSLIFAYGLDMFLTRVAPSNTFDVLSENFNKTQLVFTVSGLLLAILITRPMVQRKKLKEKVYLKEGR